MLPSVLDIAHDRGLVGIRRALAGAALAAIFTLGQPVLHGEVFKSATYQAKSQTAGIQEAVDAAAKAGGGTVQIPVGTFVLHAVPGRPAIVLRSRVSLIGAGASQTILKLEPNSKTFPAVLANQNFADPDNSEPDHDITLQGFTIDVAVSDQVLRETQLREAVAGGEQEIRLQALDSMGAYPVLRVDPGPNEEIVPVLKVGPGGLRTLLKKPHPAGARVISLVQRLHGLALVGAENVTLDDVTIENAPMDGVYLTSSVTPGARYRTYSKKINIQHCSFIACYRNGVSVIDADDVNIGHSNFNDIAGSAVDIEPNYPEQHGNRVAVSDNQVEGCFGGLVWSLEFSGPTSENFRGESITGNTIRNTRYTNGIYALWQQAGGIISGNTITDVAGDAISVIGSSHLQITNNIITNAGRCLNGDCEAAVAKAAGIRLADGAAAHILVGNTVTGNVIKDELHLPMLLYGVDFSSTGTGNTISGNTASRLDPRRGMTVHVTGRSVSNTISGNSNR